MPFLRNGNLYNKETSVVGFFTASPHSLLVYFPNLHNINKDPHAEDFRNKNRLLVVYERARSYRFNHTRSIAEKEKEYTESQKIGELYGFSNDSSRD